MDMELPGEYFCKYHEIDQTCTDLSDGKRLLKAVHDGKVPMKRLDDMAHRSVPLPFTPESLD